MIFLRSDFWKAVVAGEAIALLVLPIFQNLKVFDFVPEKYVGILPWLIFLWLLFLPTATVVGLYIFYKIAVFKWPVLFQIGKYGIVGWLNVFLSIGIFNFLMLLTGIAKGILVDGFAAIAFLLTMINSFLWNKFWTFNMRGSGDTKREYVRFFAVTLSMALLSTGLIHSTVNIIGAPTGFDLRLWSNIALAVTIPISFLGNFLGCKMFVFNDKKSDVK